MTFKQKFLTVCAGTALCFTGLAGTPVEIKGTTFAADSDTTPTNPWEDTRASYQFQGIKSIAAGKVNKEITLPTVKLTNLTGADVDVSVATVETYLFSPSNKRITEIVGNKFTPTERGTYVLYYVAKDAANKELVRSESVEFKIEGSDFAFEFDDNLYYTLGEERLYPFLPIETSSDFSFVLPMPKLTNVKTEDEVGKNMVKVKIVDPTGNIVMDYQGGSSDGGIGEGFNVVKRIVKVVNEKGIEEEIVTFEVRTKDTGVYKVTYSYVEAGDTSSAISRVYDVKALPTKDFKPTDDEKVKITATFEGTGAATTASLGKEIVMPTPKVVNKLDTSKTVVFKTKMEVVFVDVNGVEQDLEGNANKRTDISNTFKFTPKKKGYYRVYYSVHDAYKNSSIERAHGIENVSDKDYAEIILSEDYSVKDDGTLETLEKDIVNANYMLPSRVSETNYTIDYKEGNETVKKEFKGKVTIPALYAKDNYQTYDKIELKRSIRLKSGNFSNGLSSFNVKEEWLRQNPTETKYPGENKSVTVYLEKPGEYSIDYSANDGTRTNYKYNNLELKGGTFDTKLPTISDLKVNYTYMPGDEIVFEKPSATDDVDTNLKIDTRYYFAASADATFNSGEVPFNDDFMTAFNKLTPCATKSIDVKQDADEDTKNYYIDTSKAENKNLNLYIVSITTDYNNRVVKTTDKELTVLSTEIKVSSSVSDITPVELGDIQTMTNPDTTTNKIGYYNGTKIINAHQHNEVKLPFINFKDKEDKSFRVTVSVAELNKDGTQGRVWTGATIDAAELKDDNGTDKYFRLVNGGTFVPTKAGIYVATYTAKDSGGFITVVSFEIRVKDTEKPSVIPQGYKDKMELGESQTFYQAVITDNGERVNNPQNVKFLMVDYGSNRPDGVNPSNDGFDADNKSFTPTEVGEYHFKFSYKDAAQNEGLSDIIKVTVSDKTAPTIKLVETDDSVRFVESGETKFPDLKPINGSSTDFESIEIPNFFAEDNAGKDGMTFDFSVKKDGTNIWTSGKAGDGSKILFKPGKAKDDSYSVNANGRYEIKFTATDRYSNVATKSYTLAVGDVEKPVLIFEEKYKEQNQPSGTVKLNAKGQYTFSIDTNKITATDDSGKFADKNSNVGWADTDKEHNFARVTFILSGANGEVESVSDTDGIVKFTVDKAGTYTLRYSVSDLAGNYESVSYSFTVEENAGKTTFATIFWGVALSIVALAGLGVALYFAFRDKTSKKEKKVKKDKDDSDKIVV